jgi:hypothetical protein
MRINKCRTWVIQKETKCHKIPKTPNYTKPFVKLGVLVTWWQKNVFLMH